MDAERRVQHRFSKSALLATLLPPLAVLLFAWGLKQTPDLGVIERHAIQVAYDPVAIDAEPSSPFSVAGAWVLSSSDPEFGGISALVAEPDHLLALSDSGRLFRLPRPSTHRADAIVEDLPDGPSRARFKRNRDSEALVADLRGRGWWVGFEWHHQLWLYGPRFERALARVSLASGDWHPNAGIEAMAVADGGLIAFRESGAVAYRLSGEQAAEVPVEGLKARISDAANLPDGRILLLERALGWRGFSSALVLLERQGRGYRVAARAALPLGPIDNAEALGVEPLPGGGVRLWIMTDDNFQRPLRTLLVALDLRVGAWT